MDADCLPCAKALRIAEAAPLISGPQQAEGDLVCAGLCVRTGDGAVLEDVGCRWRRGELSAVLGPSGAGKTTLLRALVGDLASSAVDGAAGLGATSLTTGARRQCSALVPQDDVLPSALTPRQVLEYGCRLRGRPGRAEELLGALGLQNCADTKIGEPHCAGVSGGERRRCSIGLELIDERARVLACDEPTTGLDSALAESVVGLLADTARGRLGALGARRVVPGDGAVDATQVLITIHQPCWRLARMFDAMTIVAGGRLVFHGSPDALVQHFFAPRGAPTHNSNLEDAYLSEEEGAPAKGLYWPAPADTENPADALLTRLIQPNAALQAAAAWLPYTASGAFLSRAAERQPPRSYGASTLAQAGILFSRHLLEFLMNPQRRRTSCIVRPILGVIIGGVWWRAGEHLEAEDAYSLSGCLEMVFIGTNLSVLGVTVLQIPRQKALLRREHRNGAYAVGPWLFGYMASVALVESIATAALTAIVYAMARLRPGLSSVAPFYGALVLSVLACAACGVAIGGAFRDYATARELYVPVAFAQFIFMGYFLPKPELPEWAKPFYWVDPTQHRAAYAFSIAQITQFEGRQFHGADPCALNVTYAQTGTELDCFANGDDYLDTLGLEESQVPRDLGALAASVVALAALALFVLRRVAAAPEGAGAPRRRCLRSGVLEKAGGRAPAPAAEPKARRHAVPGPDLAVEGLDVAVGGGHLALTDLNARYAGGACGAIVGSSGAGKSTLLHTLAGDVGDYEDRRVSRGRVLLGGLDAGAAARRARTVVIPQDDALMGSLTPRQLLTFAGRLRGLAGEDLAARVDHCLELTDLARRADAPLGERGEPGASGGERKRCSIALELVRGPGASFLVLAADEPTSGLDSARAAGVCRALAGVARTTGAVVLASVHQPAWTTFEATFDVVTLLREGRVLFHGPPAALAARAAASLPPAAFESPLDAVMRALKEKGKPLEAWGSPSRKKGGYDAHPDLETTSSQVSGGYQCALLLRRGLADLEARPFAVFAFFAIRLAVGLGCGALWWQAGAKPVENSDIPKLNALFLIVVVVSTANALIQTLMLVPRITPVLRRDVRNGMHGVAPWVFAELVKLVFLHAVGAALVTAPVNVMCDLQPKAQWLFYSRFYLVTLLGVLLGLLLGLLVGATHRSPDFEPSRQRAVTLFTAMLLFCGMFVPYSELPTWGKFLYRGDPLQHLFSAVLIAYYGELHFDQHDTCNPLLVAAGACFETGIEYLDSLNLNDGAGFDDNIYAVLVYEGVLVLLVLAAFYRVAYF